MKILYLSCDPGVPVLGHKGASVHVRELVAALSAAGASIVVASPRVAPEGDELAPAAELLELEPVRAQRHSSTWSLRRAMAAQARQVLDMAREHAVDAIYERLSLFASGGVRAARLLGLPHALEVNAPLCDEALRFRSLPHPEEAFRVERRVRAATDHIFTVSEQLAAHLADDGVPREKMTVVPNGVDPRNFGRPAAGSADAFTVGFAGSLKPWHGIGVLLLAFQQVLVLQPGLRLEIVGSGPEQPAIERAGLPAESLVQHGALTHDRTIEVMSRWHVGVAPFLAVPGFYFSPLKLVEYMAAGLCPIASDLGQIRTLLGGGSRGVLVEPGDPNPLAEAILALAAEPARAAELGARARAHALETPNWGRNAEQVLNVLANRPTKVAARL